MTVPWWVLDAAAAFWAEVGAPAPFPRDLSDPVAATLPLDVVALPALSTVAVRAWLDRRAITYPLEGADRPLRACLVVRDGGGLVFLDAADGAAERRFSLAHELAHFLRHYREPRRRAESRLGGWALEVLDGRRPPRPDEGLRALLADVPLGYHAHLMERDRPVREVDVAEAEADRLAYELLAPADAVAARLGAGEEGRVVAVLEEEFGLPRPQAVDYAALLFPVPASDPLVKGFRLKK